MKAGAYGLLAIGQLALVGTAFVFVILVLSLMAKLVKRVSRGRVD